jgi:hypothetical protein
VDPPPTLAVDVVDRLRDCLVEWEVASTANDQDEARRQVDEIYRLTGQLRELRFDDDRHRVLIVEGYGFFDGGLTEPPPTRESLLTIPDGGEADEEEVVIATTNGRRMTFDQRVQYYRIHGDFPYDLTEEEEDEVRRAARANMSDDEIVNMARRYGGGRMPQGVTWLNRKQELAVADRLKDAREGRSSGDSGGGGKGVWGRIKNAFNE